MTGPYTLTGHGFNTLPPDVVGVYANDNDDPTGYAPYEQENTVFDIEVINDSILIATPRVSMQHSRDNYLGCIVSGDRQTTYWVNASKPLP